MRRQPSRKVIRDSIKASVPDGKLKAARIVLADTEGRSPIGGFTEYDRKKGGAVVKLGAPIGDNAFSVSVRGHETAHASRHKPQRKKLMTEAEAVAGQIIDDVNVESQPVPDSRGARIYKRAHLAVAMRDVRTIVRAAKAAKAGKIPNSVALRNANIQCATRALAMLRNYGADGENVSPLEVKTRLKGFRKLRDTLGDSTFRAVSKISRIGRERRNRTKAISMLLSLMETEEADGPERETKPDPEGEILAPVTGGDAIDGKMNIINLMPKSVPCAKEKTVTTRYAPNGVIINATRYVSAIVSGDSNGLFSRRVREKAGGCVLIDASGSMGANRTNLAALCKLMPTATVAYYSGMGTGKGDLCVYAYKGKRFNGELTHIHGGNSVDLPAIKWMLRHSKPWVLVSDLAFCGGVIGSEDIAHVLVDRAVERGDLKVYRSLEEAYKEFGGKGEMPEPKY